MDRKPLPVGLSDFKRVVSEYYYVDKTDMIRDIIDFATPVSLFTRPRRFGKTLNMSMIQTYFEKTDKDNSVYFKDLNIWKYGEKYTSHQGKYPVIFLTFKDVKTKEWTDTENSLKDLIATEFTRHAPLKFSQKMDEDKFNRICDKTADRVEFCDSLKFLSRILFENFNEKVIIIIDEYDTPIQSGYSNEFFEPIVSFMRNFFSGGFKDNSYLQYGFMTGILRVAKENIFSGLNNVTVYSILEEDFSEYFGFTQSEVDKIAQDHGLADKIPAIKEWYDGYIFGHSEIYNPWSVTCCIKNRGKTVPYWLNTSSNDIIGQLIADADKKTMESLTELLNDKEIPCRVDPDVIYPQLKGNSAAVFSFLAISGYVKLSRIDLFEGRYRCLIKIPNREIRVVYETEILNLLTKKYNSSIALDIADALYECDMEEFQNLLNEFMKQSMSFFDASESFYHGLILGLYAIMTGEYRVVSNRESGLGRFDVALIPLKPNRAGYIFELKSAKENEDLDELAKAGLAQINDKEYITELKNLGVDEIIKTAIAFCGKETAMLSE